jgi:hypothetical protein
MAGSELTRRDALRNIAAGGIGLATSTLWVDSLSTLARERASHAHAVVASAQSAGTWAPRVLNDHQLSTVATLSELIIPQTDTPGAKAALVDRFIDSVLQEAAPEDRGRFVRGLAWIDARSTALFRSDFISATAAQQVDLLTRLSADNNREQRDGVAFFNAIKSMTIAGYYTSEIGLSQELGDQGPVVLAQFAGCTHPEHQPASQQPQSPGHHADH